MLSFKISLLDYKCTKTTEQIKIEVSNKKAFTFCLLNSILCHTEYLPCAGDVLPTTPVSLPAVAGTLNCHPEKMETKFTLVQLLSMWKLCENFSGFLANNF